MTRPGAQARAALGGDEAIHVFDSQAKALDYAMRMPGARTLAPRPQKTGGWGGLIAECRSRPLGHFVRDCVCVVEVDIAPNPATRIQIRSLAQELYKAGALEVRCCGRRVARSSHQTEIAWR